MARIIAFVIAGLAIAYGAVLWRLASKAYHGTLPYGSPAGMRTTATLHDDAAWRAGQRATVWYLRCWAGACAAAAVICFFAGAVVDDAGFTGSATWLVVVVFSLVTIASFPFMMRAASKAALKASAQRRPRPGPGRAAGGQDGEAGNQQR